MSDPLKIALVAEGPTDKVVIESALKAILPFAFVLTLLQPEATVPMVNGGWPGILKWCSRFRKSSFPSLEDDPTLELFDFIILHIDADVAHKSYSDAGCGVEQEAPSAGWKALPCNQPCPPPAGTVDEMKAVLLSWLGLRQTGDQTILCIPSKSTEVWLAAAVYPDDSRLLNNLECTLNMEDRLKSLPKSRRIKKNVSEYNRYSAVISSKWGKVRELCTQAELFHRRCVDAML